MVLTNMGALTACWLVLLAWLSVCCAAPAPAPEVQPLTAEEEELAEVIKSISSYIGNTLSFYTLSSQANTLHSSLRCTFWSAYHFGFFFFVAPASHLLKKKRHVSYVEQPTVRFTMSVCATQAIHKSSTQILIMRILHCWWHGYYVSVVHNWLINLFYSVFTFQDYLSQFYSNVGVTNSTSRSIPLISLNDSLQDMQAFFGLEVCYTGRCDTNKDNPLSLNQSINQHYS